MSTQILRPQRSMSYNDIKKRRMLRQSQSKKKLKFSEASTQIVQTEKKKYVIPVPAAVGGSCRKGCDDNGSGVVGSNDYRDQRQVGRGRDSNWIGQQGNGYVNIREIIMNREKQAKSKKYQCSKIPTLHIQGPIQSETTRRIPAINFTDRLAQNNTDSILNQIKNSHQTQCIAPASSRQIIKDLIQERKSERKLIRFQELRNKFKLSKSRSRSNTKSVQSLAQRSRCLANKLLSDDMTPQKPELNQYKVPQIKNILRIKKFQSYQQSSNNHFQKQQGSKIKNSNYSSTNNNNISSRLKSNSNKNLQLRTKSSYRYLISVPSQIRENKTNINQNNQINSNKMWEFNHNAVNLKDNPIYRQKQMKMRMEQDQIQSSIQMQKQSCMFDSQDGNLLEQMCLKMRGNSQMRKQVNKLASRQINDANIIHVGPNYQRQQQQPGRIRIYYDANQVERNSREVYESEQNNQRAHEKSKSKSKPNKQKAGKNKTHQTKQNPQPKDKKQNKNKTDQIKNKQKKNPAQTSDNTTKNKSRIIESSNILDLLDVESEELSNVINKKQRQKRILHDLQKLNKKFPKGFFKL